MLALRYDAINLVGGSHSLGKSFIRRAEWRWAGRVGDSPVCRRQSSGRSQARVDAQHTRRATRTNGPATRHVKPDARAAWPHAEAGASYPWRHPRTRRSKAYQNPQADPLQSVRQGGVWVPSATFFIACFTRAFFQKSPLFNEISVNSHLFPRNPSRTLDTLTPKSYNRNTIKKGNGIWRKYYLGIH
jgi:hypothetical protein